MLKYKDKFLYCDSIAGALVHGKNVVCKREVFTRGLAVSENLIILGGSEYGERSRREGLRGALWFLDSDFNLLHQVEIPAMVQEVRFSDRTDFGLSNSSEFIQ